MINGGRRQIVGCAMRTDRGRAARAARSSFIVHRSSLQIGRSSFRTHHSAVPRAGFTLVEMLMVLIIVGLLASMLTVAVSYAIKAAKRTAITVEIGNLDAAMQNYKSQNGGEYPPCMAVPPLPSATLSTRYDLFNRALRKRFPRYTGSYSSTWPTTSTDPGYLFYNYWYVRNLADPNTPTSAIRLNLDNLDAAEALVFWLAGPPTPTTDAPPLSTSTFRATTMLYGFSANPTTPFDATTGSRTPVTFGFDESRLTDADQDGWPEYTPASTTNQTTGMPPYVYFDAMSTGTTAYQYSAMPYYLAYPGINFSGSGLPSTSGLPSNTGSMLNQWGFVTPYATQQQTSSPYTPITWWNPKKFQIISSGLDAEYGASQYDLLNASSRPAVPAVAQTSTQTSSVALPLPTGDNDNLTNFVGGRLEDYVPQ